MSELEKARRHRTAELGLEAFAQVISEKEGGTWLPVLPPEPWVGKQALAEHYECGVRWVEMRVAEGMPSAMIAGRRKFRLSEVEPWLERAGHIDRP